MCDRPDWDVEGREWRNREASRFVEAGGLRWHVQVAGEGPSLLLLHGTGASTHSWRDLLPLLARRFSVVAPDLPGHGFTSKPSLRQLSLPGMSKAIDALLIKLGSSPEVAVGHSAGAAVALRMTMDAAIKPKFVVSLNGALLPFPGLGGHIFPTMAKLLYLNPFAPRFFAWQAKDPDRVSRLIAGTGSKLDEEGLDYYVRLFRYSSHVAGALHMMANWDLHTFKRELPRVKTRVLLIAGAKDRAVPNKQAYEVSRLLPNAEVIIMPDAGHLAHEEQPEEVARLICEEAERTGVLPGAEAPA